MRYLIIYNSISQLHTSHSQKNIFLKKSIGIRIYSKKNQKILEVKKKNSKPDFRQTFIQFFFKIKIVTQKCI